MPATDECPICCESMGVGTGLSASRPYLCDHVFCTPCVSKWSWLNNTCPLCRAERSVSRLRHRVCCVLNVYFNVSSLLFLLHVFVMLSGRVVTITYDPDSRFENVTLECSSWKVCFESHTSFLVYSNKK